MYIESYKTLTNTAIFSSSARLLSSDEDIWACP